MWTSRALALFFSLLMLSESTAATVGNHGLKIAQHSAPTASVPLRPEKQQLYQQGIQLVTEARELKKKGLTTWAIQKRQKQDKEQDK